MPEVKKPGKRYKAKRPTRDEFELEELGERLVEAKQEESTVVLTIWDEPAPVRGRIVKLDARTRLVHVEAQESTVKIPFLDIMRIESPRD
ncbi:YolD-like family protein [Cohnella sp. JJ-181]|uniref:YolD-like family protein n=1 Tax=Cohnella rhizoplanae TaxID=2974897 RepID=UPI0022FF5FC9|nr:YolD-like family protein [Cohnella sp. JJ-181]CAI6086784.1 hypothetical protein COHCIP112018_05176 [Cohnella sp. JJ-181]